MWIKKKSKETEHIKKKLNKHNLNTKNEETGLSKHILESYHKIRLYHFIKQVQTSIENNI